MIKSFAPPVPTGGGFAFGAAPKGSNQDLGGEAPMTHNIMENTVSETDQGFPNLPRMRRCSSLGINLWLFSKGQLQADQRLADSIR